MRSPRLAFDLAWQIPGMQLVLRPPRVLKTMEWIAAWNLPIWLSIFAVTLFIAMSALDRHLKQRDLPPGPWGLPVLGNMIQMMGLLPHKLFTELGKKYGPVVFLRIGFKPYVVINSAEMAKQVLKVQDVEFANRPPSIIGEYLSHGYNDMAFRPYNDRWKQMHKICVVHLFSYSGLRMTQHIRKEELATMVTAVLKTIEQGGLVDTKKLFHEHSMNLMCRILFSKKFFHTSVPLSPEIEAFHELMAKIMDESGKTNVGDVFPALRWLDLQGQERRLRVLFVQLRKFLFSMLDEHKRENAKGVAHKDFTHLLQSLKDEEALSEMEQVALLSNLLLGGLDTTLSVLDYTMAELLRHPECMQKAREELDLVVGRSRTVDESDISSLPYLQAIVKESLRLHPPGPIGVPHYNLHETRIGKHRIPAKSNVFVNLFGIGRDPATWADPEMFNPERFMGSDINLLGQHFEFIPFSAGRRGCPGMPLAMLEVPTALATLMHAFDWEAAPLGCKIDVDKGTAGIVSFRTEPLLLQAASRLPESVYDDKTS